MNLVLAFSVEFLFADENFIARSLIRGLAIRKLVL